MSGRREAAVFLRHCDGRMDLFRRERREIDGVSEEILLPAGENRPCAYIPGGQALPEGDAAALRFAGRVFAPPEPPLEPGMAVILRQRGQELRFITCGLPAAYPCHQEIPVQMDERL